MQNNLKVLFVASGGKQYTAARDRIYIYFDNWPKHGVEPTEIAWKNNVPPHQQDAIAAEIVAVAQKVDVVYLFRAMIPSPWMKRLRARAKCIVWDYDDAIYHVPSPQCSAAFQSARSLREKMRQLYRLCTRGNRFYSARQPQLNKVLRDCDAVVAGNTILADYARRFVSKILVAPTPIDVRAVPLKDHKEREVVTIGWTGTPDNVNYLEAHSEAFKTLGQKYGDRVRLKVVSQPRPMRLEGITVEFQQWTPDIDKTVLLSFDIGIMPLTDDGWSRGKCGFKALLCMAAGLPTVVSPVGINAEIIADGVDGFHARSAQEWAHRLGQLVEQPALRKHLGTEARRKVENFYDVTVMQGKIAEFLRLLCRRN